MNSLAVIRANDSSKLRTTLHDLVKYGHMSYANVPKRLEPSFADSILVNVMKSPLKSGCTVAAVVPLMDSASAAISRLRKIHPPAHVIIVSPRHKIYHELIGCIEMLPEAFPRKHPIQKKQAIPLYGLNILPSVTA
ncbi:hypothetical protein METP2_03384 [Methanosarcinales archaeon]|nr:DUF356 domain-containing protein [Candidatus Methanoperedens sp.]CAG1002420.1 hypothetical protein METP2_03384 [Methanosarcinales archaeon]